MSQPIYTCTQQQLYTISRAAWQACNARLVKFTALKPKYTALFITGKLNAITAAEDLMDDEQRKAVASLLRDQLIEKAGDCRDKWQTLKLYILEAFPENEIKTRLTAAGAAHYEKAGQDNWEAVRRLMKDGDDFIGDNTAALEANDNMPTDFDTQFATLRGEFDALYNNFVNASLNTEVQTDEKIAANNAVYKDLISMLDDGKRIFVKEEAIRKLFTFDQLLNDVAGPGTQGMKGTISVQGSDEPPAVVVTIEIPSLGITKQTNAEGKFQILQIPAGTYSVTITATGYQPQTIEVEVEAGVVKNVDVELVGV